MQNSSTTTDNHDLRAEHEPVLDSLLTRPLTNTPPSKVEGIVVGTLTSCTDDGQAVVDIADFGLLQLSARSVISLEASRVGAAVALGFEQGDPLRPIILGFMQSSPASVTVQQDGAPERKLVLEATRELELRCGETSLTLTSDGRIQLRGRYITSHASATQRILGGSVQIN
ncbi:DUF6484 domain-containing protein [Chitinimonas sp.]|uniref:DUF6484 domain-containing protein n=1 Tax=Chitinimonas sp. TaxID=1934313 RepID=UPI002F9595BF